MPHSTNPTNAPDTGLICLAMLARYHGFAADSQHLSHQYATPGAPFSITDILRAARGIGLKARQIDSRWERLAKTPLPAIAQHEDGHYFILGKLDGDKALIQDPLEKRPSPCRGRSLSRHGMAGSSSARAVPVWRIWEAGSISAGLSRRSSNTGSCSVRC